MNRIKWCRGNRQHAWIKVIHELSYKGMQCFSCPMCEQLIYWSNITESWVNVTKKPANSKQQQKEKL